MWPVGRSFCRPGTYGERGFPHSANAPPRTPLGDARGGHALPQWHWQAHARTLGSQVPRQHLCADPRRFRPMGAQLWCDRVQRWPFTTSPPPPASLSPCPPPDALCDRALLCHPRRTALTPPPPCPAPTPPLRETSASRPPFQHQRPNFVTQPRPRTALIS